MSSPVITLPAPTLAAGEGFYFADDDVLRVASQNITANLQLAVGGRMLQLGAKRPSPFRHPHVPNTDRSVKTEDFELGCGWLQNVTVSVVSSTPINGACFVVIDVVRGRGAAAVPVATLA